MSAPAEIFAQAASDIVAAGVGETATITYNGEDIVADIYYGQQSDEMGAVTESARIIVTTEDVPDPQYRDTVVIGSDTWRVKEDSIKGDDYLQEIPLRRDERQVL